MTTNRELLEGAARAAGYTVEVRESLSILTDPGGLSWPWNPLENDGDAFRLMVDCGIEVVPTARRVTAIAPTKNGLLVESEDLGTNKHAATRRAVVRAAAAMGVGK